MIQRKCGTCRYFEEGGIASSGWCRHPERQDLQHMVLVRKTELACRDGWDHDLWEPVDDNATHARSMTAVPAGASPSRSERKQLNGANQFDSVGGAPADEGITDRDIRAVDHQRLSNRISTEIRQPDQGWSSSLDRSSLSAWSSTLDTSDQFDEVRDETFSTRGLRPDAEWRRHLSEMRHRGTPEHDSVPSPPLFSPEEVGSDEGSAHAQHVTDDTANRSGNVSSGEQEFGAYRSDFRESEYEPEPVQQSGLTEPFEFAPAEVEPVPEPSIGDDEHLPEVDQATEGVSEEAGEAIASTDAVDTGEPIELPMAIQGQRCCRTCRDFRPSDAGKRGWCNNPFAFEKRQQVDGDGIACQGTFGNWWSPSDDWWIERADISHHSTPTPLVEELIRAIRDRRSSERGSTARSERS